LLINEQKYKMAFMAFLYTLVYTFALFLLVINKVIHFNESIHLCIQIKFYFANFSKIVISKWFCTCE